MGRKRARTVVQIDEERKDANLVQTRLTQDFGFRAKRHANHAPSIKSNAEDQCRHVKENTGAASFGSAAVKVDPLIKRVYRLIDRKSYLVWGLTSDWDLRERSARVAPRRRPPSPRAPAPATTQPPRDDASEGYGEMTAGSIQRLLNLLRVLHLHLPADLQVANLNTRACTSADEESQLHTYWDLTKTSSFIDIGSGYGKVVLHAGLGTELLRAHGVEYVASRAEIAGKVLLEIQQSHWWRAGLQSQTCEIPEGGLDRVSFVCGDATVSPYARLQFTHVYIYDKVFTDETISRLAVNLNQSPVRVLVSYQRPETWFRLGLSRKFMLASAITMNTTGNQSFRCHVFLKGN